MSILFDGEYIFPPYSYYAVNKHRSYPFTFDHDDDDDDNDVDDNDDDDDDNDNSIDSIYDFDICLSPSSRNLTTVLHSKPYRSRTTFDLSRNEKKNGGSDYDGSWNNIQASLQPSRKKRAFVTTIPIRSDSDVFHPECGLQRNPETNMVPPEYIIPITKKTRKTPSSASVFATRRIQSSEINSAVSADVFSYFDSIWDVPADGNCGYYVLFDFLRENGLLPKDCQTISMFRRLIHVFAVENRKTLLHSESYFSRLGYWRVANDRDGSRAEQTFYEDVSKIYDENVNFEGGCPRDYWMNANIVMPLVVLRFNINIWVLSADGDPYIDPTSGRTINDQPYTTMYTLTMKENQIDVIREVVKGQVAFPLDSRGDEDGAMKTAYVIHMSGNHYVIAKT